jgi:acylphosphatase
VEQLLEECRRGPPLARVERVDVEWGEYKGDFEGFEVRYSELELPR